MKRILIIPAFIALMATSCGESSKGSGEAWAQKYKDEMIQYIGEVLPYVPLNEDTIYSGWDADESCYYIGDDNYTDLLSDYGSRLTSKANWTATVDSNNQVCYTKKTDIGTLWLYAQWFDDSDSAVAGNEIDVYVDSDPVIPGGDPVDGTFEVKFKDFLNDGDIFDGSTLSSITAAPGITFAATKGTNTSNSPKYFSNGAALRLYTGNTYTISADNITKIEFELVFDNEGKAGTNMDIVSGGGSYTYNSSSKIGIWSGDTSSIQFKVPDGQKQTRIASVTVTGSFSGEGDSPADPEDSRTTLSVAKDIAYNLFGPDVDYDTDVELYEGDYYVTVESTLNTMQATVEEGKKYIPDYLELEIDTTEDTEDADGYWYAIYLDEEFDSNGIVVQIGSYYSDDVLLLEYMIYDYWA